MQAENKIRIGIDWDGPVVWGLIFPVRGVRQHLARLSKEADIFIVTARKFLIFLARWYLKHWRFDEIVRVISAGRNKSDVLQVSGIEIYLDNKLKRLGSNSYHNGILLLKYRKRPKKTRDGREVNWEMFWYIFSNCNHKK